MARKPPNMVRRVAFPESLSRPVATPLQPSIVYASRTPDELDDQYEGREKGFTYSREGHPNAELLAGKIDQLEGVTGGIVVSSGMAAVSVMFLGLLRAGDHVIGGNQLYGRSLRLMNEELPRQGIETSLADPTDISAIADAIRPNTRLILIETVSNPTIRVADVEGIIALARDRGILIAVDNTFTTPLAVQPLRLGADIVIHSISKLMGGHSDVMLGYVAAREAALNTRMVSVAVTYGFTGSPFDCWLAERGLFTFALRYQQAEANASALADHIAGLPGVERVLYPGRGDHPDHNRAAALLAGRYANMLSFVVSGGRAAANRLASAVPGLAFAPTLGDVGTTLSHPMSSSHRALSPEEQARIGISEGFFRVSVGIEDIELLCADFETAIGAARG